MQCKRCSEQIEQDGKKEHVKLKLCVSCYRAYERGKSRRKKDRGLQTRECPNCSKSHQSPGYCGNYCSDCFRERETIRKNIWRINNREKDRARLKRYRRRNPDKGRMWAKKCYHNGYGAKQQAERIERKKKFVDEAGGKCSKCGYNKNLAALVFHHIDPSTKTYKLSSLFTIKSTPESLIREEMAKCELLCHVCHSELHDHVSEKAKRIKIDLVGGAGGSCRCGYNKNPAALIFHHKDPAHKDLNITRMIGLGMALVKIRRELAKCELLCANCHTEIHHPD